MHQYKISEWLHDNSFCICWWPHNSMNRKMIYWNKIIMFTFWNRRFGALNYFLWVNIVQNSDLFYIHQGNSVKSLLVRFGFENSKPISKPVDVSISLEKAGDDFAPCNVEKYQSAVAALLYLSMRTRPDITFAVCNVAKFAAKPTFTHWLAVKQIFRGEGHFGAADSALDNSAPCRFGAGHFGAVS